MVKTDEINTLQKHTNGAAAPTEPLLEARALIKEFATKETSVRVLDDISFRIRPGEFVSVMGPSGSGKSTLLYLLGGLEPPTSGSVLFDGTSLYSLPDAAQSRIRCRDIGFIFQFYNLIQSLTVEENILLPLSMSGVRVRNAEYREKLNTLLDMLGLTDRRNATPDRLSGGQQQRVAIARALITGARLILADEPTGNLDSSNGARVMELFDRIHRETDTAIVLVTHDKDVAAHSDRLLIMQDGKIIDDVRKIAAT